MNKPYFVIDNNILISKLLLPHSIPAQAVRLALDSGILLTSDDILRELLTVLTRSKFDKYNSINMFLLKIEKSLFTNYKLLLEK